MMVFRRMNLDTGKRWLSSGSGQISDHSIEGDGLLYLWKNINNGKDCSITSARYTTVRMSTRVVTNTNINPW